MHGMPRQSASPLGLTTMAETTVGRSYSDQRQEFISGWKDRACGAGREALTDIFVKAFKEASTVRAFELEAYEPRTPQVHSRKTRVCGI